MPTIEEGKKLKDIDRSRVGEVNQSNKGNLIFKYREQETWYFIFDHDGNKIPIEIIQDERRFEIFKKAIGNEAALDWLIGQIGNKKI